MQKERGPRREKPMKQQQRRRRLDTTTSNKSAQNSVTTTVAAVVVDTDDDINRLYHRRRLVETTLACAIGDCIGAAVLRFSNANQTLDIVRDHWFVAFLLRYASVYRDDDDDGNDEQVIQCTE